MKKLIYLSLIMPVMLMLAACPSPEEDEDINTNDTVIRVVDNTVYDSIPMGDEKAPKYSVKSGIITMNSSTMGMKQKIIMYFDDYGNKQATKVEQELMGQKVTQWSIMDTAWVYSFNSEDKTGKKTKKDLEGTDNINFNALTNEMIKKYFIRKKGTSDVAGKTCDVYIVEYPEARLKGTFYVWKGITLKSHTLVAGMKVNIEAEKIEVDVAIPSSTFKPPKDITFETVEKPSV